MCDGAIYADPGRRSRCRPKGGYLRGMHIEWEVPLRELQLRDVISWGLISGGGYLRHSIQPCVFAVITFQRNDHFGLYDGFVDG